MAIHLKIVFVSCLLLLLLMEKDKPVLGKEQELSKTETEILKEFFENVEERLKALEECQACSKIKELNNTVNELKEEVNANPELADCGDPGVPVHGSKTGKNYSAGGMVTFTCDAGYHLEGTAKILCLEIGKWNNALPKCRRICNEPAPPENGYLIGSEFWKGKNVTYKCNKFHELQGPTVRVCDESGEWTGKEPTCEPKYPPAVAGLEDSAILKRNASYLEALGDFLKPVVKSGFRWKRCWQASQDGWEAATFHSNCNDKGPSVTIIRVGRYIFGGYTSLSWGLGCHYHYDSAAFLYSLVNYPGWQPVKLNQIEDRFSIVTCLSRGPTFGWGFDIYIADLASSNTNSYTNPGKAYSLPSGYSAGSSSAQSFLAGSKYFQPDEVEVFYETT